MKKKAFTLVELIVVITILAILGTIAFISLSGYSKEARDAKRVTDTSSLLSKINIEETRGTQLSDLITTDEPVTLQILGEKNTNVQTFREANFKTLKEDEKNFRDPSNKEQDYPLAYAIGGTGKDAYKFIQIATISEKENKALIKGNYYRSEDENDAKSLFLTGGTTQEDGKELENGGNDLPYELEGNGNTGGNSGSKYNCASTKPNGDGIKNTIIGNPIEINQAWIKNSANCGFTCNDGYEGDNCENLIVGVIHSGGDLIISDGTKKIIIADRNLGANEAGIGENSYGNYYQWGRNDNGFTSGNGSYSDWQTRNDNAWGGAGDTNISSVGNSKLRQSICPDGYHIPSTFEWKMLIKTWFEIKGETCDVAIKSPCSWKGDAIFDNFRNELKLPAPGYLHFTTGILERKEEHSNYWSSSPNASDAYYLTFSPVNIWPQNSNHRSYAVSMRCFKD